MPLSPLASYCRSPLTAQLSLCEALKLNYNYTMGLYLKYLFRALMLLVLINETKGCLEEERKALLRFKAFLESNGEDADYLLPSWVNDRESECCNWERVTCDSSTGHVTELSLNLTRQTSLHGDTVWLLNLTLFQPFKNLKILNLSSNRLDGWTQNGGSDYFPRLKMLETLDLSNNNLNESVVRSLASLYSLKNLNVAVNQLEGSLPVQELSVFRNLEMLNLSFNGLNGSLIMAESKSLSRLKRLKTLDISFNEFDTSIIQSLSPVISLKNLFLTGNQLEGPLPIKELSVFENLEMLDLSNNGLNAPLRMQDSTYLSKLRKLKTVDFSLNYLDKEILRSLGALPALRTLYLHYNTMEGHLSDKDLSGLRNLEVLMLRGCGLNGTLPNEGLCALKNLLMLDLSGNKLRGAIPPCIGNLTSLRALDLSSNQLSGNISSSIFDSLTSLEYLSLSGNYFGGLFLLSSLANHSKLKVLTLAMHGNRFQVETENPPWFPSFQLKVLHMPNCSVNTHKSTIPSFLFYQHDLINIDLSRNQLVGMFPNWLLHNNSQLEVMVLNDNSFIGSFELPTDPNKRMYQLHRLHISSNKIEGQLPQDIGFFLPNIESLDMSTNAFHGSIPSSIGRMSRLMMLDLANNNFSGEVPRQLLSNCTFLVFLRLSNNSLHGQLFPSYWNLTSMRVLTLDNNYISGTMQDGLLSSPELFGLDISDNQFSGSLPSWLASLQQLYVLSMSGNNFEGEIPNDLCKLNLEFINLSQNKLSGYIPSCLNKPSLKSIHLQGNKLVGSIPEAFSRRSNLVTLDLRYNQLSGDIPNWIYQLRHLKVLLLAANHFEGRLPQQLCLLQELNVVDLSHNIFTGSIPLCFSNVSFGQKEVSLRNRGKTFMTIPICLGFPGRSADIYNYAQFDLGQFRQDPSYITYESGGHEVVEFTTKSRSFSYEGSILDYMSGLDLSCNQLSGEIPEQIGDLIGIRALNLSRNYFNGSIPPSLSKLVNVESLDLSYNNLSGEIPSQLDELHSLAIFNVSYNHLSGSAPSKGQFGTFDESSYIGNPDLRWTLVNDRNTGNEVPPTPSVKHEDDDSAIEMVSFYWSFCTSYVMVLLAIVTVFCINPYWKALWFRFIDRCVHTCFHWLLKDALY